MPYKRNQLLMNNPSSVTVLIPVYNGEAFLREAVESVLSQQNANFDVLIIDDGSTDCSFEILSQIACNSMQVYQQVNRGLAATLNRGIELASGKYIARQDQDDLMLADRLRKQVEFLDQHSDCALVGTWSTIWVGNESTERGHLHATSHEALRLELLFDNPFVHSSVMLRANAVRRLGGYSEDKTRQPPEDYELWSRIARDYRVANIPEVLTVYREVQGSMSRTEENPFLPKVVKIASENLAAVLSPKYSMDECYLLASLYHGCLSADKLKRLGRTRTLRMHKQAAIAVGGKMVNWSDDFHASFNRQHTHLKSKFFRRHVPSALLHRARQIKQFLQRRVSYFYKGMY